MKVSYNWLKDYCDLDLPVHKLAERLSQAAFNVESYGAQGDDYVLDVEVTTNRPDCLCHLGLAREIAAIAGGTVRRPDLKQPEAAEGSFDEVAAVEVTAPDLCPHYTARLITGVRIGPSPSWMQERLSACGIRPINNIVDATNYVMLECGQPLHAFDLAKIGGRRIIVRRASPGETITTIDGSEHELTGQECLIADDFEPVALAGVMGGVKSEISDSTTDVLLESARFDPRSVRRTSRAHGLASESSYRFERGIDPETTDWASRRACQLIVELGGGTVAKGSADIRADSTQTPEVTLRLSRLALVLGLEVARPEAARIFRGLELKVVGEQEDSVTVRVPSWRSDLRREIDLIEEVARIHGYDKIGETTQMPVRPAAPSLAELAERRARRLLAAQGFHEVMTYSLVTPSPLQAAQPWCDGEPLGLRNPVSVERTHLRLTNMANLLEIKKLNQDRGTPLVHLYELGRIYLPREEAEQPEEKLCLTALTDRDDGQRVLKGVLANLADELGVRMEIEEVPSATGPFEYGESVELRLEGALLGCVGTVARDVVGQLDLRSRPALMEIDFRRLAGRCRLDRPYSPVPSYPGTGRDLAIVVGEEVLWADIKRCIEQSAPETLEVIEFLDVYRGEPVPEGRKSVAFRLAFRRRDRTITTAEAEDARSVILAALGRELGAELR